MVKFHALLVSLFCIILPHHLHSQEGDPRELFSKGYALFSEGKLDESETILLKALELESPLKDYCLYFLAMGHLGRGKPDRAREYFNRLANEFPRSVWSPHAELQSAKISMEEKAYRNALEKLAALRAAGANRTVADEALYLLGQVHELQGDLNQAHSLYQGLRRLSPLSQWAAKARTAIRKLRELRPELFGLKTIEALVDESDLLVREREFDEAEKVYLKILDVARKPDQRPGFLTGLANVYRAVRKRDKAIPVLAEIVSNYPDSPEAPSALYHLALIYWNRDDNLKALDYFSQLKIRYGASPFADFAHYASARIYESLGKREEALQHYESFPSLYPHSRLQEEAQWRLAWFHYKHGDFGRARDAFNLVAAAKGRDRYKTAALYWQARTAMRTEKSEEAKGILRRIVSSQEDSYYKELAARELARMGEVVEERKMGSSRLLDATLAPSPEIAFHLARAQALAEISLNSLAVAELDVIQNRYPGDALLTFTLAREYARNSAYGQSVALVNRLDPSLAGLEEYRYPLAYWGNIKKISEERQLDPFLVLALIRQESLFDPKAVSPASAAGLMQLIPSTAARTAKQLGLTAPRFEDLFEPNLNLALGTHYLKGLLQRYSNDLIKALAAYNAGENAVARWEQRIQAESEEEFIERIPYGETRLYVKLVLRNHLNYRRIYGNHQ